MATPCLAVAFRTRHVVFGSEDDKSAVRGDRKWASGGASGRRRSAKGADYGQISPLESRFAAPPEVPKCVHPTERSRLTSIERMGSWRARTRFRRFGCPKSAPFRKGDAPKAASFGRPMPQNRHVREMPCPKMASCRKSDADFLLSRATGQSPHGARGKGIAKPGEGEGWESPRIIFNLQMVDTNSGPVTNHASATEHWPRSEPRTGRATAARGES
jgi:hypothetical protein